jgi:HK97 family phage prohead protease
MTRFKAPASIETLALSVEQFTVEPADGQDVLHLHGLASVFGSEVDAWIPTVIHRGAFKRTLEQRRPQDIPLLWAHDVAEVLGYHTALQETDIGLEVHAVIIPTTANKDRAMLMKAGAVRGLSIGFDAVLAETEDRGAHLSPLRHLREVRLWETSACVFPADQHAHILEVHACTPFQDLPVAPPETPWDPHAAEARLRAWAEVTDRPNERYRRAFLWVDPHAPERLESYRLPIADLIEGELAMVPQALAMAHGCLPALPPADRARVQAQVSRYEEKITHLVDDEVSQLTRVIGRLPRVTHEGKVLSGKNKQLVQSCIDALHALMMAADPPASTNESQALAAARRVQQLQDAELLYAEALHR